MTKSKLFFVIFLLSCLNVFGFDKFQDNPPSVIKVNGISTLKRVQYIPQNDSQFIYNKQIDSLYFTEKGHLISSSNFRKDSSVSLTTIYQYDERDSLISELKLNADGMQDNITYFRFIYFSDELVEKKIINQDQFVESRAVYKYLNSKPDKIIYYDASGSQEKYDSLSYDDGKLSKIENKTYFGKLLRSTAFSYDIHGVMDKRKIIDYENDTESVISLNYGKDSSVYTLSNKSGIVKIFEIKYFENELIDEIIIKNSDKKAIEKIKYIYSNIRED